MNYLNNIIESDCLSGLSNLPDGIVDTCITSPPYWRLRDYDNNQQFGMEATPEEFITKLVDLFREVRRVLKDSGTLWVNIGDTYYSGHTQPGGDSHNGKHVRSGTPPKKVKVQDLKKKDLVGIPWMLAFALELMGGI